MASRDKLIRRRQKEGPREVSSTKRDKSGSSERSKCPIFNVQYLGKLPARGEYGREYIAEPVESLLKLKEKQRGSKTTLTVSEKGFHFLDQNGPFGKEKHVLIPLHNICYGVADEASPRVFAIITRTDSNSDSSLFECHAFLCEKSKISKEITYWLLRTFLQVFEDLQRKRKLRQERKLLRKQQGGGRDDIGITEHVRDQGRSAKSRSSYPPDLSPDKAFESGSFSVILEGSRGHGAAVGLTRGRSRSHQPHSGTSSQRYASSPHSKTNGRDYNANDYTRSPHVNASAEVYPSTSHRQSEPQRPHIPHMRNHGTRSTYVYSGEPSQLQGDFYPGQPSQYSDRNIRQPQGAPPSGRYVKNHLAVINSPGSGTRRRGTSSLTQSSIHEDSDFLFIDLLHEEFADPRQTTDDYDGFSVRSVRGERIGPPNQKLRSEDIEKRIQEWLSAREEPFDDISVFEADLTPTTGMTGNGNFRRQWSNGDNVSLASSDSYF
ncbi:Low density lipoprotein receptor adapter protein 1 [Holothuria leucospilota]|uniref:Low density lipoprotein receptor adapter protein 1 n=1 Tax=Holothuria leucospilota TaxID=206669 RepID=A0A9Q1CFT8_HOLLE|nr:Low density lipoprotein receptor adapter protein 1 [Holothuria leucospilota]